VASRAKVDGSGTVESSTWKLPEAAFGPERTALAVLLTSMSAARKYCPGSRVNVWASLKVPFVGMEGL
jgi:hypothetical protein